VPLVAMDHQNLGPLTVNSAEASVMSIAIGYRQHYLLEKTFKAMYLLRQH